MDKINEGTVNFVKIENIDSFSGKIDITSKITEKEHNSYLKRSQLKENDLLFSIAGTLGRVAVVKSSILPANTNQALAIIRLKNGDINYIKTYLKGKTISDFIRKNPTIGAQPNLSLEQVNNFDIIMPDKEEQQKLSALFNSIDNLITLHQSKYDKLVNVKKALLEKMFPKDGKNVPEIRFKGFTDTWEQRKLLDVANYKNGKAHENDIDENGKYIVVNSKFVSTEGEVKKYSNKQNEPLNKNDIAFVLSDVPNGKAIAKTFLVDKSSKYTLNQRIAGITPHEDINPKYLAITMNRNKYFLQFDDGVKQTNLSLDDMQKYENYYPTKEEQDKLGHFFEKIDNLITLHQHKQLLAI